MEESKNNPKLSRRNLLRSLATLPVLGIFGAALWSDRSKRKPKGQPVIKEFESIKKPEFKTYPRSSTADTIRIGIIGFGGRGAYLCRALGHAHPEWVNNKRELAKKDPMESSLKEFFSQEDLNLEIVAVSDLYKPRIKMGIETAKTQFRSGSGKSYTGEVKVYPYYRDLLNDPQVDAVVIATTDHWHVPITLDAIQAGKHIYQEKCFAHYTEEAVQLYNALQASNIVYQLGHQNHQSESHLIAEQVIKQGLLGHLSLIKGTTHIHRSGTWDPVIKDPSDLDWEYYEKPCLEKHEFDPRRFFLWRNYFDYGTGLFGDLLSHEFASINQIARLGIPASVMTSGGTYGWDYYREIPDVFSCGFDYPDKKLILNYTLSMGSSKGGSRHFMGKDATMEVEREVKILPEPFSETYQHLFEANSQGENTSFYLSKDVDSVTSATERYFAKKGLYYTPRNGKFYDATHLHMKEWLDCIRFGGIPVCDAELGFQEGITCFMAMESHLQKRPVYWDDEKKIIY